MRPHKTILTGFAAAALGLAAGPALAAKQDAEAVQSAKEREWVLLSGIVEEVGVDTFELDYGKGEITVETDDFDWQTENALLAGDRVTVTGRMDEDFFEKRSIEAASVYLPKLDTYYYARSADEEDGYYAYPATGFMQDEAWVGLTGSVDGIKGDVLRLDVGSSIVEVDTSTMLGEPDVEKGDRVIVYGEADDADLLEDKELLAESIVSLAEG